MRWIVLISILLLLTGCASSYDTFSEGFNLTYTMEVYDVELDFSQVPKDNFAKGDFYLVQARLEGEGYEEAILAYNDALVDASDKEKALLYETLGSITGEESYYLLSYQLWEDLGDSFRSNISLALASGEDPLYWFDEATISEPLMPVEQSVEHISIGSSSFFVDEEDVLVSQVDRVTRDWLSSQLQHPIDGELLTIFSEGYDLESIGWHEGGRIEQYLELVDFEHKPITGTIVRNIEGKWYAPNEHGIFMFEVPIDKVQYPTTRFFNEDLALIVDTHGINMLVRQAIQEEATVVVGCCDHPGKVAAALYLNERGIKVICNTDKYLPLALGQTDLTLGSVPFYESGDSIQFGAQSIELDVHERIIVMNATEDYGLSYYQTPALYFSILQQRTTLPLELVYVTVSGYGQMSTLVNIARKEGSSVIAARVYDGSDYSALKGWLESSPNNRLILFHSEPYPYGYKLLREYPFQVTFDDPKPVFY
jgi:hypothetical protein